MKHLFLAESDYAASGNSFALALRSIGEDSRCLTANRHIFEYPEQGALIRPGTDLEAAIDWADWLWIVQSDLPVCMGGMVPQHTEARDGWLGRMAGKRIAVVHGGGTYRNNREFYAGLWKTWATVSFCFEADLMGSLSGLPLGEHLVLPAVNLQWFNGGERRWRVVRVGHFPARPTEKGSEWIVPLMQGRADIDFRTSVTDATRRDGAKLTAWRYQLLRMSECDIIIDQIKPVLANGQPFGEWVSLALEAAALGRVSIANSLNQQPYLDTYGEPPGIHVCNDRKALVGEIDRLAGLSDHELREEQRESRAWVKRCHALEPTGRTLARLCNPC